MAIPVSTIRLLARTLRESKVTGNCLTLGVQAIEKGQYSLIKRILSEEQYNYTELADEEIIRNNLNNALHQDSFFRMLGYSNVHSLDYFPDDNPTYVTNLNNPIGKEMYNRYDMIFDGGTIEHCFNVKEVMSNIVRMLKIGGRTIHVSPMSGWLDHGFYQFSPCFYYDYYGSNGFNDMKAIIQIYGKKAYCIDYDRRLNSVLNYIKKPLLIYFTAKKQISETDIIQPIQSCYCKGREKNKDDYNNGFIDKIKNKCRNLFESYCQYKIVAILYGVARATYYKAMVIKLYKDMTRLK